jgi:hypothetical protein
MAGTPPMKSAAHPFGGGQQHRGLEEPTQDQRALTGGRAQDGHPAARGVEEGERGQPRAVHRELGPSMHQVRVGHETEVVEDRALREARGAGRVLHLGGILGPYLRQRPGRTVEAADRAVPLPDREGDADAGQARQHLTHRGRHVRSAELIEEDEPGGSGLTECVAEFGRP